MTGHDYDVNHCCHCGEKVHLTRIRKSVYDAVVGEKVPIKAYDIIERLKAEDLKLTPATIYRSLDYLIEKGLIHRINSLNAYVSCTCSHHDEHHRTTLLLICSQCHRTMEIQDPELCSSIYEHIARTGMTVEHNCIEIQGLCSECRAGRE